MFKKETLSLTIRNVKLWFLAGMYEIKKTLLLGKVVSFKYLGVFIDKHLNFDLHIEHFGKKLAQKRFSKTFLLRMYNSYAKPMAYGILAFGSAKRNKTQFYFLSAKTHFKVYLFQEERRPCMQSFQALQRAVSF